MAPNYYYYFLFFSTFHLSPFFLSVIAILFLLHPSWSPCSIVQKIYLVALFCMGGLRKIYCSIFLGYLRHQPSSLEPSELKLFVMLNLGLCSISRYYIDASTLSLLTYTWQIIVLRHTYIPRISSESIAIYQWMPLLLEFHIIAVILLSVLILNLR